MRHQSQVLRCLRKGGRWRLFDELERSSLLYRLMDIMTRTLGLRFRKRTLFLLCFHRTSQPLPLHSHSSPLPPTPPHPETTTTTPFFLYPVSVSEVGLNKMYLICNNTLTTEQLDRATSEMTYISIRPESYMHDATSINLIDNKANIKKLVIKKMILIF